MKFGETLLCKYSEAEDCTDFDGDFLKDTFHVSWESKGLTNNDGDVGVDLNRKKGSRLFRKKEK